MAKEKRGRKTVMTEKVIDKLEEAFAWGCTDIEACLWADIAPATLYQYQEKNPAFTERKEALKETPILEARKSVLKGIKNNPDLALKLLERKKKNEYSLRQEVTGADGRPFIPILGGLAKAKLTDDIKDE